MAHVEAPTVTELHQHQQGVSSNSSNVQIGIDKWTKKKKKWDSSRDRLSSDHSGGTRSFWCTKKADIVLALQEFSAARIAYVVVLTTSRRMNWTSTLCKYLDLDLLALDTERCFVLRDIRGGKLQTIKAKLVTIKLYFWITKVQTRQRIVSLSSPTWRVDWNFIFIFGFAKWAYRIVWAARNLELLQSNRIFDLG